jgi:hypothetical protein
MHSALANKRAANSRARALLPTVCALRAKGFVTYRALADELNRKGIPAPQGGSWHLTTVVRMLTRLGLITVGNGRTNNKLAHTRAADARAMALAATIRKLGTGFVAVSAIARELNAHGIPAARGGKWHVYSVTRLLQRLERLEPSSRTVVAPMSDAEPKARSSSIHRR